MTAAELLQWQEKAVEDAETLLAALGGIWQRCNEVLRDEHRGHDPAELRNALVQVKELAGDGVRRVMQPPPEPSRST